MGLILFCLQKYLNSLTIYKHNSKINDKRIGREKNMNLLIYIKELNIADVACNGPFNLSMKLPRGIIIERF